MTVLLTSTALLDTWLATTNGPRGVVLTMGALHEGHAALMRQARAEVGSQGTVLATVFVNPTQFGPTEDFERYPRTLDADVALCAQQGVDAVFAPSVDEVYPPGTAAPQYDAGPLGDALEGAVRPGHFSGVLSVVSRLLQMTHADVTCFGEKDYQQLALVRRLPTLEPKLRACRFVGVPIVRDHDGLALSSRNRYLSTRERARALAIPACIELVQARCAAGASAEAAEQAGAKYLAAHGDLSVDYLVVRGVDLGAAPARGEGRVLVAARVGSTRLLDNGPVQLTGALA